MRGVRGVRGEEGGRSVAQARIAATQSVDKRAPLCMSTCMHSHALTLSRRLMRATPLSAPSAARRSLQTAAVCQWRTWCTSATAATLGHTRHLGLDDSGTGGWQLRG